MSTELDYDALASALRSTVESMAAYQINRTSVEIPPETQLICGGYGNVRRVKLHREDGPSLDVALKELRPAGDEKQCLRVAVSLVREVRVWSILQHPNIAQLVGFHLDLENDTAWLLSPWEPFGNVVTYLKENDVDEASRLKLALDTAEGLNYLHTLDPPVYHGDIKGANLLISHDRRAKWCDFGLAKVVGEVPSGLTTSQSVRGTTCYFSPELLDESGRQTLKSDVWAWGCVFIEVLVGRTPYEFEGDEFQVITAIFEGKTPVLLDDDSIPATGKEIAARCWSADPATRPTMAWCADKLSREVELRASCLNSGDAVQAPMPHEWRLLFRSSISSQLGDFQNLVRAIGSAIVMAVKRCLAWGWLHRRPESSSWMLGGKRATREGSGVPDSGLRMPATMSNPPDAGGPTDDGRPLPSVKPRSDTEMTSLAVDLYTCYEQNGDPNDLALAIAVFKNVLERRPPGHPARATSLNRLGRCLLLRHGQMGDGEDLAQAISLHQESLSLCPIDHPERRISLSRLASCLSARYDTLGDPSDLTEALRLQRESSDYRT